MNEHAPYSREGTSHAAAHAMHGKTQSLRERVYHTIRLCGENGATDEEVQNFLQMPANTERPRRVELERAQRIEDSGQRRLTRAGRKAIVWVIAARDQP